MPIVVTVTPPGGRFNEFTRLDIQASDSAPGALEVHYTVDGSVPDTSGSDTITRRAPIIGLPLDKPTTLKVLVKNLTSLEETTVATYFFDIVELTAVQEIKTVPDDIKNYTLRVEKGDLIRTGGGLFDIVYGARKVVQDIKEVILVESVEQGKPSGNRTLPRWGSGLNRIFGRAFPVLFAASQIQAEIFTALTELIRLQREEFVPNDERINRIVRVIVSPKNETDFSYYFEVETVTGRRVNESGILTGVAS